jgi:chaperonin GroEL
LEHTFENSASQETRYPLIIIAPEFSQAALHVLFNNLSKFKEVKIIALKAPEFGIQQSYTLHDIAIYTGGKAILKSEFDHLQDMNDVPVEEILGHAKMEIKRDQYAILEGRYDKEKLDQRIDYLNQLIDEEEASYMQDKLMQRKAKLMGSISIIFVGAETPVEADEIHDRVDDAVNAVKGAIAEGVVKGGGVALMESCWKTAILRENDKEHNSNKRDFHLGYNIVLDAGMTPFKRIITNAEKEWEPCYNILKKSNFMQMMNIRSEEVVDIYEAKILDPKKITVNALKSAVSISSTLMSTRTSITGYVGESEE